MASRNNSLLQFEMKGGKELEKALRDLGQDRLIKATMKRALVDVAKPTVADAQARAAAIFHGTGRMAKKIAVSSTLSRRQRRRRSGRGFGGNEATVYIGAAPRGPAVIMEFGTGPRRQKTTGKSVGAVAARPFMRPAWEANKHKILDNFAAALWRQIERSATRLGRRQMKAAGIRK